MVKQKGKNSKRTIKLTSTIVGVCAVMVVVVLAFIGVAIHSLLVDGTDWMPTTRKFQMHDKDKIKASGIQARAEVDKQFIALGYDSKIAAKKSLVDLCYRTTREAGFSTIGYTKTCNLRETMIFTSSDTFDAILSEKVAAAQAQTNYEVRPDNEPPCKTFYYDAKVKNIEIDTVVCPRSSDLPNYLKYNVAYSNEKYQNDGYEIRGPLDSAVGIESKNLNINYLINSAQLYDFTNSIKNYADSSNGNIIIVGVTNRYYSDDVK